jgi:hypothetical protein
MLMYCYPDQSIKANPLVKFEFPDDHGKFWRDVIGKDERRYSELVLRGKCRIFAILDSKWSYYASI